MQIIMMLFAAIFVLFVFMVFDVKKREKEYDTKDTIKKETVKIERSKEVKNALQKVRAKVFPGTSSGNTIPAYAPTIYVRVPGQKHYVSVKMDKLTFSIGRNSDNDIVLDDPTVSDVHAKIVRFKDKWGAFYYFHNLKTTNGTHYYNQDKKKYELLKQNEKIDLEEKEAFYIGDYKIIIETPQSDKKTYEDELDIKTKDNDKSSNGKSSNEGRTFDEKKEDTKDSFNHTKMYEGKETSKDIRRKMNYDKYTSNRIPSGRNTSEDELNNMF